ncbi:hypothetical protein ACFFTK_27655 [Pseudonocardia petroleophila]|uniref:Uncharacterized protein n=1 Tax=Pseudonocardia petroleophila TaxID=37331 RepID=A0A7G7MMB0_9PSEU|nr:hypothetical protein [Pseudonocardia petroleophila]QNG53921.1 hypothetical protein H6H00_08400 [Pseudonocardia petroleophila]
MVMVGEAAGRCRVHDCGPGVVRRPTGRYDDLDRDQSAADGSGAGCHLDDVSAQEMSSRAVGHLGRPVGGDTLHDVDRFAVEVQHTSVVDSRRRSGSPVSGS